MSDAQGISELKSLGPRSQEMMARAGILSASQLPESLPGHGEVHIQVPGLATQC